MSRKISAVVLGASGYVGGELLRLIAAHPAFELATAVSDSCAGRGIGENFGHLAQSYAGVRFVAHANWLDTVEAGDSLALFTGIDDFENRKRSKMHVTLKVFVADQLLTEVAHQNHWPLYRNEVPTGAFAGRRHPVRFEISSLNAYARAFCFRADTRK